VRIWGKKSSESSLRLRNGKAEPKLPLVIRKKENKGKKHDEKPSKTGSPRLERESATQEATRETLRKKIGKKTARKLQRNYGPGKRLNQQ